MQMKLLTAALLVTLQLSAADAQPRFDSPLFALVADVPLGPAAGRIDYQSLADGRLYVSMMGAGKLLVFDTSQNQVVKQLDGFPKTTGVLAAGGRVYSSVPGAGLVPSLAVGLGMLGFSSGQGAIVVVDAASLREIARLPGGVFPDGLADDPKDHRLFVSDEMGGSVTVIDTQTDKFITRMAAGGEVGNTRYDPQTQLVYAPIQSKNALGVFDPVKLTRLALWPLAGCSHPHGMAIAPHAAIGFVACDENDVLLTVDLANGKILSHLPLGHDPDVLALDPVARRLYVAGEAGKLSTFDITNAAAPVSLGETMIGPNAHSVAVDPATHRLYFPLADQNGRAVMRILTPKS
jgi:DNA-binding beta-propeller fold protein YncE